ncbi:MAG: hypothetical protein IRZ03_13630 [Acidobacterium ailaaui]|nr:hypothetical protein [Pseudacidobacterium ailaaui]
MRAKEKDLLEGIARELSYFDLHKLRQSFLAMIHLLHILRVPIDKYWHEMIGHAWDIVRDPAEPQLPIPPRYPAILETPSSADKIPKVRIPGVPGITGE